MLPERVTTSITVWPIWIDPDTGTIHPMRRVLKKCSWRERSISVAMQTGNIVKESSVIRIFDKTSGLTYLPPYEWLALPMDALDGFWTVDLSQSARPIIANFESEETIAPGTSGEVTKAMNQYRLKAAGIFEIADRNDNRKGIGGHIALKAG